MKFDYVEIGTSCFKTLAEVYRHDDAVVGLSIEPVPQFLNILKKYCKGSKNKHFLNCAVSDKSETIDFYFIDPKTVKNWIAVGIAGIGCVSVDELRDTIRTKVPDFEITENQIKKISIPSVRFGDVVKKHSINEISFLKIDAEGCDYDILMDWSKLKLKTDSILFEAKPFMKDAQIEILLDIFKRKGYTCDNLSESRNFYCYQPGASSYNIKYKDKNSWIKWIKETQ